MRKYSFSLLLVLSFIFSITQPAISAAISVRGSNDVKEESYVATKFPEGENFTRLKALIDETFTLEKKKSSYYYGYGKKCIESGWLCANYKYTSLTEKAIKYIILETYEGNEDFYNKLFQTSSYSSYYNSVDDSGYSNTTGKTPKIPVSSVLQLVPTGTQVIPGVTNIFAPKSPSSLLYSYSYTTNNLGSNLLSTSFGIDFTENGNQNSMLAAIEQKIKDMKRIKCQKKNQSQSYSYDSNKCPWNGEISNQYLPTIEELFAETIYVNGRSVKIASVKDEIEYQVIDDSSGKEEKSFERTNPFPKFSPCPTIPKEFFGDAYLFSELYPYGIKILNFSNAERQILYVCTDGNGKSGAPNVKKGQFIYKINGSENVVEKMGEISGGYRNGSGMNTVTLSVGESPESTTDTTYYGAFLGSVIYPFDEKTMDKLKTATSENEITPIGDSIKKMRDEYGADKDVADELLKEVDFYKNKLENAGSNLKYTLRYMTESFTLEEAKTELEKQQDASETVFRGSTFMTTRLPCSNSTNYFVRSECAAAQANMNTIMTTLGAYYSDTEKYPESLDALNTNYLPRQQVLEDFKKNFSYKLVAPTTNFVSDYEITYIGKIGEGANIISDKIDYVALLSGATVPNIPKIFLHAPSDSAILYIKNPQNLFALLETKSNTTTRLSGIDVSQSVKQTIQDFFELKDFTTLEKNLQHEALLVIENLDFSAPDVTLILSEEDRAALSPSAKARVVGSKDGFIYVSNSKSTIDRFMNMSPEKSLSSSPDFRYVWTKKSSIIKDAYMFVGDAFFEKMLTFETYITHYRKIRDVERLGKFQELVWSYQDAYGKLPSSFEELLAKVDIDGKLKIFTQDYTIGDDGKVIHKNIGTLGSIRTLSEVNYDLSKISRSEVEDYKVNVLKYRDIWRASLDPMGIVMNRYGDGMEIDFFMTPIPKLEGELRNFQDIFEGVTKDSFEYLSNPKLRLGLLTFVAGFDPKKLEKKAESIKELSDSINQTNSELLGGKSIFEYIGGEGAFTLGNIPPDILDGWNVEKIDAHLAIEFTSEEKGKEFVDIIRKRLLSEYENASDGYLDLKSFFSKPLIEDYEGEQIFYVEAIPVPFVGKIGFAYTFIDNYFFIGLNRTSMRHVIDVAISGDSAKQSLLDESSTLKNSFFVSILDGKSTSTDLKGLYEKNRTSIPRYAALLDKNEYGSEGLSQALASYYITSLRSKRLGVESKPFDFSLGGLSVKEVDSDMWVRIDETLQTDLSGTTLQLWNNISTDERFPKEILSQNGIKVQDFLANTMKSEILAFELIVKLDHIFAGSESLLRNSTFSVGMNDNEIGFLSRVFRDKGDNGNAGLSGLFSGSQSWQNYAIWLSTIFIVVLLLGGGFIFYRRKKQSSIVPGVLPIQNLPTTIPSQVPVFNGDEVLVVQNSTPLGVPPVVLSAEVVPEPVPNPIVTAEPPSIAPVEGNNTPPPQN